jgi:hypothetical protein
MKRIIPALALLLTACSGGESVTGANKAIAQFHEQLNGGNFHQIYAASDTGFQKGSSETDASKLFAAVHSKLGAFKSGSQGAWRVNYNTAGNNTVVQFNSVYEKGKATETFTFVGDANAPRLYGYNIDSPTLITG